jgi:glycosyltransferase involved in cell wall biosynthesis
VSQAPFLVVRFHQQRIRDTFPPVRRILLLITDLQIGGTPTVVREVATRLHARDDVNVEVACLGRFGPVAAQLRDAGVHVTAFGARSPVELVNIVWKLVRLLLHGHFDTVVSFLIHANTVAAIASRFVSGTRFIQSIQTTQPRPRWHWWLQRIVHHAAEQIVVPSPSAARVAHEWSDVPPQKIVVIPNAIDPGEFRITGFQPVSAPAHGLDTRDTVKVGFIGRLDPVKRIPDLLRAIASLDLRYTLHIFGEGAERAFLRSMIDFLGITDRVTLHGLVMHPQAALAQLDLLVLPSQAEGFGLVLIEAMAAGVPVVATDVAGICDVVRNGETGLLVPVASPAELARAIREVSEDRALRGRLIENGLREVRVRYTWDVVFPMYVKMLELELESELRQDMRAEARTPEKVTHDGG